MIEPLFGLEKKKLNEFALFFTQNKIRRVHLAAREGSLRDLQSALDRRKFAVARDDCSPGKCTPIHVATIFGHASMC